MSDTDIFESKSKLRWYHYLIHLGYYVPYWIKFFFGEPFREPKKDLNILDIVKTLGEMVAASDSHLSACHAGNRCLLLHRPSFVEEQPSYLQYS